MCGFGPRWVARAPCVENGRMGAWAGLSPAPSNMNTIVMNSSMNVFLCSVRVLLFLQDGEITARIMRVLIGFRVRGSVVSL